MQNKEIATFLALLRMFFALEWTTKWIEAFFETNNSIQVGEFVKNKTHKSIKTLKNDQK